MFIRDFMFKVGFFVCAVAAGLKLGELIYAFVLIF